MSVEDNKQVVKKYMETMCTGDFDALMDVMTEDATWTVPGDLAVSGEHPKLEMKQILEAMATKFASPVVWEATGMIGEGDKVAAECLSSIDTSDGKEYRNRYHILFQIRDGKIAKLVEYCDTKHVQDIFLS